MVANIITLIKERKNKNVKVQQRKLKAVIINRLQTSGMNTEKTEKISFCFNKVSYSEHNTMCPMKKRRMYINKQIVKTERGSKRERVCEATRSLIVLADRMLKLHSSLFSVSCRKKKVMCTGEYYV